MSGEAYEHGGRFFWETFMYEEPTLSLAGECVKVMGVICKEMAYGKACDSCFECSKLRAVAALDTYFETRDVSITSAVARDGDQNVCLGCIERIEEIKLKRAGL